MFLFKNYQKNTQIGAVLAEFAILIPFLLLLLAGIAEIGYTYFHLNVLNKSVEDAARYFSDPLRARHNNKTFPIDTAAASNAPAITQTKNLVIYGKPNPLNTDLALLPPNNGANYTAIHVSCAEEDTLPNTFREATCVLTTAHIRITAFYNHNYLFSDLLRNLCGQCIPPTNYPLTASAVFRVEGGS
jgi:Flp pilus assembly protein TadG